MRKREKLKQHLSFSATQLNSFAPHGSTFFTLHRSSQGGVVESVYSSCSLQLPMQGNKTAGLTVREISIQGGVVGLGSVYSSSSLQLPMHWNKTTGLTVREINSWYTADLFCLYLGSQIHRLDWKMAFLQENS